MNDLVTLTRPRVYLGKADPLRLPELLAIEKQALKPLSPLQNHLTTLQSGDTHVALAEVRGRMIGFALYKATGPSAPARLGHILRVLRCRLWQRAGRVAGAFAELLRIGVHRDWQRQGIGRALLRVIHEEVEPCEGCIRATVPESNLAVQLLLRDAGYKAIRILYGDFDSEDGYLMEWRP
jgi:ribosomal protein S18 acetylase RimI-like enzyme